MDEARSNPPETNLAKGTLASILLAGTMIVLGVLIPPRWKLFGIYPLVLGGVLGLGLQRFLGTSPRSKRLVVVAAFLLPIIIWNAQHLWLHRQYATVLQKGFAADPTRAWGIDQSPAPEKDESEADRRKREDFQKELERIDRIRSGKISFQGYLLARVRPLSVYSHSGAWGVYAGETLLVLIGCLLGIRLNKQSIGRTESS